MAKKVATAIIGIEEKDKNGHVVGVNMIADKNTLKSIVDSQSFTKEDAILLAGALNYVNVSIPELAALLTYIAKYITAATTAEQDAVRPLIENALKAILARSTNQVDEAQLVNLITNATTADDVINAI